MRRSNIELNEKNSDFILFNNYSSYGSNRADILKMKVILSKALKSELTGRQRECIMMYFYENKRMRQIAKELSLSPSTVTRHIKAGKRKLENIAKYY
ncbi:MAG: sigma-70 family RNA polymerase sigma factor [Ruminococcus sp.]|nr:sigma-70 family RNA polymerase sigma factor [Ruminococcus sp.]